MTSHSRDLPSVSDICAHVKHVGYAISSVFGCMARSLKWFQTHFLNLTGLQFT